MNIRRLEYFLSVVDTGTVTHAAAQMHIAQPAMSRQIRTLERELKLNLFVTEGNRLVLTAAGRQFSTMAREVIATVRGTEHAAASLRTGRVESLTVATTVASARGFLADFIATTTTEDPALIVRTADHYAIEPMLDSGADLIISPAPTSRHLRSVDIADLQVFAYVPDGHELLDAGTEAVGLDRLCDFSLIVPSASSVSRRQFDAAIVELELEPHIRAESDDGASVIGLSSSGHGIGIGTEPPRGAVTALPIFVGDRRLSLRLFAAWRPEHFASAAILDLAHRAEDFLAQRAPSAEPATDSMP